MHQPSPISVNRLLAWLGLVFLAALVLWLLAPVLAPFVVAAVLAYVLHPMVRRLLAWHVPPSLAVVVVETLALMALLGLLLLLLPVLMREWPLLRQQVPVLLDRLDQTLQPLLLQLGIELSLNLSDIKVRLMAWLSDNREDWLAPLLASLRLGGNAALAVLGYMVLVPVALFFMLHDWEKLVDAVRHVVPPRWRQTVVEFATECDTVLGEYLRGQMLVMLALAVFYSLGLALFGLDLALPIGVFTGLAVFVPYLGFGLGLLLALLAGVLEFSAPSQALVMVAVVYGLGQLIESFVLTPRLVGQRIGLHPLAVILALMAFGQLLGFVGVLIALPASAVALVALRRLRQIYMASPLFTNDSNGPDSGMGA